MQRLEFHIQGLLATPEVEEVKEQILLRGLQKEPALLTPRFSPLKTSFGLLTSRTQEYKFVLFYCSWNLLQQQQGANTGSELRKHQ